MTAMATEPAAAPKPVDPDARRLEWVKAVGMPAVSTGFVSRRRYQAPRRFR